MTRLHVISIISYLLFPTFDHSPDDRVQSVNAYSDKDDFIMADWLQANSSWLVPLSAAVTILTAAFMLFKWLYQRFERATISPSQALGLETANTDVPKQAKSPPISMDTILRTAYGIVIACFVLFLAFAFVMMIRGCREMNANYLVYKKQVDEAYAALQSGNYAEFQTRVSNIDPAAKANFRNVRGGQSAYQYSNSSLKETIENYELMMKVCSQARDSPIFLVKTYDRMLLYAVDYDADSIRILRPFRYSGYGWQWSPKGSKFAFYVQRGLFSIETKFWVVNPDGEYLKQVYSTESADELVRWESENIIVATDNGTEKRIRLTKENNPQ